MVERLNFPFIGPNPPPHIVFGRESLLPQKTDIHWPTWTNCPRNSLQRKLLVYLDPSIRAMSYSVCMLVWLNASGMVLMGVDALMFVQVSWQLSVALERISTWN